MNYAGNEITTLWIDLDDTLIDFTTNARAALTEMWQSETLLQKLFSTPDCWALCYEHYNMALWARYNVGEISRDYLRMERFKRPLLEGGLSEAGARAVATRFDTIYLDHLAAQRTLMPGALTLMKWLHGLKEVKIGILSNGFKEVQYRKIHTAGLDPYIDLVVLSDDININKPDRRLFEYAMKRAGDTNPVHHLMIGDNPVTDIGGALGADWNAIWYHPARAPQGQCPAGAAEVNNLDSLPALLGTNK